MTSNHAAVLSDRQARAVVAAAESHGFERESHLLWWKYDDSLHSDAVAALQFLRQHHPDLVEAAISSDDPLPVWVAVERIMDERGGLNQEQVRELIQAAVEAGLMSLESGRRPPWPGAEWEDARVAVEFLWQNDFGRLSEILGDHVRLATVPETALHPCPSVCEHGWVRYKFAGELPAERPRHWFTPY